MKNNWFKKALPHIIAVGVFLIVTLIFCRSGLESGVSMRQNDITSVAGMTKQLRDHHAQTGTYPLWVTNMFSGMPAWQVLFDGGYSPLGVVSKVLQLGLPEPFNFFFLACICFYIFCMCLRIRPWVAVLASLGFAFCSYNPIIITEGHVTKMMAMAYAPALLGSVILLYERKYFIGFVLSALFAALQIQQNHPQITYYLFLIIVIMSVFYLVRWIKEKSYKNILPAFGLAGIAAVIGLMVSAVLYFPVYDYTNYSKRGGQLVMSEKSGVDTKTNVIKDDKTVGLTKEYAFQWSYGIEETLTLIMPGASGYGLTFSQRDGDQFMYPKLDAKSHVATTLTGTLGVPEMQAENFAMQLSQSLYWGDQPFTRGPVYLGAIICFLFIFAMFYLDGKHKWWLLAASVLGIAMAWGKFFPAFNNFLFDYLPYYNKLRVPTLALFIPQLLFPVGAALAINKLMDGDKANAWKPFKNSLIAVGAIFAIALVIYISSDFSNENKQRTLAFNTLVSSKDPNMQAKMMELNSQFAPKSDNSVYENLVYSTGGNQDAARNVLNALKKDRASLFGSSLFRSFIFVLLAAGLIFMFIKNKFNEKVLLGGLIVLVLFDLLGFDSHYLNKYNFDAKDSFEASEFPMTSADQQILQDKDPNYRVLNTTGGDPYQESKTSYYHKSVGGYHPAKLGIYDDLITYQLSGGKQNIPVLNMLNTKYIIAAAQPDSANPQAAGQQVVHLNPDALGNAWFVKGVKWVNGAVEEMKALDQFNPKDTAIVDASFKSVVGNFAPADSTATIKQTAFDNDAISYESNNSNAGLAIFSEIYYKDWNAYIDGKPADIFKANYVLRGLNIPVGKHTIDFKFEPKVYATSRKLSSIFNWLLVGFLVAAAVVGFIKKPATNKS
ncbi:MAG: YfhO family protein [Niabella sp.]